MQINPRLIMDYTSKDIIDNIVIVTAPVLILNSHCFWTYSTNHGFITNFQPNCRLNMYRLDGQKQDAIYGFVFTYHSFVASRLLPVIVALVIAVLQTSSETRRCSKRKMACTSKLNHVRRFFINERCVLDFRDRSGPLILFFYLLCTTPATALFVLDKVLSFSGAPMNQCFLAGFKLVQAIGQQLEFAFYFCFCVAIFASNRCLRQTLKSVCINLFGINNFSSRDSLLLIG